MCNEFVTHMQQQCVPLNMGGSHTSGDVDMMCTYESDEGQMPIDRVVKRDGCNRGTTFAIFENVYGR